MMMMIMMSKLCF